MLDDLDSIPWADLTHAYGSAEDVPDILRALRWAPRDMSGDESPLYQLFGNIWHQGTVYEATAYAVPFLLELAADPAVAERVGILQLLAEIADGTSYRAVHGDRRGEPDFLQKRSKELGWVRDAHDAVGNGFDTLRAMTQEEGEVRIAAAHVLAKLPERGEEVAALVKHLHDIENAPLNRAGYLLLLGLTGDRSADTVARLMNAVETGSLLERRAGVVSLARIGPGDLPASVRRAMVEALSDEAVEETFDGLPWDAVGYVDREAIEACLDTESRRQVVDAMIAEIEAGHASHNTAFNLVSTIFTDERGETLTPGELSPVQLRAVKALAGAICRGHDFRLHFPQWRLPGTRRGWRYLAAGQIPPPVDMSLPLVGDPDNPQRALRLDRVKVGQRVHHRHFGLGTVRNIGVMGLHVVEVEFDEEGVRLLRV